MNVKVILKSLSPFAKILSSFGLGNTGFESNLTMTVLDGILFPVFFWVHHVKNIQI